MLLSWCLAFDSCGCCCLGVWRLDSCECCRLGVAGVRTAVSVVILVLHVLGQL